MDRSATNGIITWTKKKCLNDGPSETLVIIGGLIFYIHAYFIFNMQFCVYRLVTNTEDIFWS